MRCYSDDVITDLAMSELLNEALPESRRAHLDECDACRQAVKRDLTAIREVSRAIRTDSVRPDSPCLSDNDLSEFLEGCASEADAPRIEAHLARCAQCVSALVRLDNLLAEADNALSPVRYAIQLAKSGASIIARPDRGFRLSLHEYVPTLKDGALDSEVSAWSQNVDGHALHFKLQHGNGDQIHLTVSIESRGLEFEKTTITLRKNGDLVQSQSLGADGSVRLPSLQRGNYAFEINSPEEVSIRVDMELM